MEVLFVVVSSVGPPWTLWNLESHRVTDLLSAAVNKIVACAGERKEEGDKSSANFFLGHGLTRTWENLQEMGFANCVEC